MKKLNNILLIDDDNINNFINEKLIKKLELTDNIKILSNGDEALTFFTQTISQTPNYYPELILLDINMPVMDGFEFLEEYKNLPLINKDKVIIIMLSTSTNPGDITRIKGTNALGFVNKPLTEEKLRDIYNRYFATNPDPYIS